MVFLRQDNNRCIKDYVINISSCLPRLKLSFKITDCWIFYLFCKSSSSTSFEFIPETVLTNKLFCVLIYKYWFNFKTGIANFFHIRFTNFAQSTWYQPLFLPLPLVTTCFSFAGLNSILHFLQNWRLVPIVLRINSEVRLIILGWLISDSPFLHKLRDTIF